MSLLGHHFSTFSAPMRGLFLRAIAWGGKRDADSLATPEEIAALKETTLSIWRPLIRRISEGRETMPRFMVIVPASKESEAGVMPDRKILTEMGKFNEEMVKAGVMLAGEGLHPTSKGARIKFSNGKTSVTDGPFTESKELIAGFWLIQVKSKQEAVEWMRRAPFGGGTEIEIRQVFETEDFGDALTPELRESEDRMRERSGWKK